MSFAGGSVEDCLGEFGAWYPTDFGSGCVAGGRGTSNWTTPLARGWWMVFSNSILILCGPGVKPPMLSSEPLVPCQTPQTQGASSTVTWICPIRGETASAALPNTGITRRF